MSNSAWPIRSFMWFGGIVAIILIVGFGGWASFVQIGGAILANGQIEVGQNRQVIQHVYGGQINKIFVKEGQSVL